MLERREEKRREEKREREKRERETKKKTLVVLFYNELLLFFTSSFFPSDFDIFHTLNLNLEARGLFLCNPRSESEHKAATPPPRASHTKELENNNNKTKTKKTFFICVR